MVTSRLVPALGLVAALAAAPVPADWLVLADGTRVETRGPWSERGKLLVFTAADGTLASLRLSEVDLEASRQATEAAARPKAKAPQEPAPVAPPPAALVLTDADVRRAPGGSAAESEGVDEEPAGGAGERLVVTDWQEAPLPDGDGVRITGTLRNVSASAATRIRLTVLAYDAGGELLATGDAMLSTQSLMPNRQARFQVDLFGIYAVSALKFRPTTLALDVGAAGEAGEQPEEPVADADQEEEPEPQPR